MWLRSVILALLTTAAFLAGAGSAVAQGQTALRNFGAAGDLFWDELYPDGFVELYCGRRVAVPDEHNIEHVFPAFWMTKALGCGARRTCRRNSIAFNHMEADLHNLFPARIVVNSRRGSFPFGEIPGEDHDFPGCDFEEADGIVEPRPAARGEIARAVLHMVESYGAAAAVPSGQFELMRRWDQEDPPDAAERQRHERAARLQGTRNRFIDAHPQTDAAARPAVAARATRVRVATWNITNLHFEPGQHLPGRPDAPARSQADYDRLARYVAAIDADVFAFQEVNGPEAARLVFPQDKYTIVVSDRFAEDQATGQPTDHIYTGIAVKKGGSVNFIAGQTYRELSVEHVEDDGTRRPTRRGTEVLVELPNGEPLQVMSVHLKSGCHNGNLERPTRPACTTLAAQRAPLEAWIDELTAEDTPFVIAGDWNRRLDRFGAEDHLWRELDDGEPVPLDLVRFPEGMDSPCLVGTDGHFREPIDFLVLDEQAARWVDPESFRIVDLEAADKPERDKVSDHCPAVLDLVFPR